MSYEIYPDRIVTHYRDFTLARPLDKNGKPVPSDDFYKCPMPRDKMLFAPTFQIVNLFDPMPAEPTLANDLSSFTQVFLHTLLVQRKLAGAIRLPELAMYRKMLATDPLELREHRFGQVRDAKDVIRYYDGWTTPRPQTARAEAARSARFGDMVSVMKHLTFVLECNYFQGNRNRFPDRWALYEGDPKKTEEEYEHYMGAFANLAEDYEEVQAKIKARLDEQLLERLRRYEEKSQKAEIKADEGEREPEPA
ncbi:hypothetical protein L226DRAFT_566202 [Lentinus tigrinus ALCF2SS1-7]|uniref:Uncharacterized protein n=1 Tax=Lentinus tigrinus ALCF2SS1-6 TaxID=1328759 RepID=A0A5C2SU81_9APHY|nr:hypothetical protein L227DRAFT_648546 [Lentinus tigrinus ALCF2SS1-6]RPD81431.1 hypothetical protein L226DRAFT_566202 [Lentinus tigrinus ALCF2SS1-7]